MLTETFTCSTVAPVQSASNAAPNPAPSSHGVFEHALSPLPALRSSYKQSSAHSNCLALTSTHVFAAQDQKALIHVYNREKGSLEARVPFNDKISSLAILGADEHEGGSGTLVLGMEAGRLLLWELATGRMVSSNAAHLQAVTNIEVDATSNWILSASADAVVHVWSVLDVVSSQSSQAAFGLSSGLSPVRSFSDHRAPVTALAVGHSSYDSNIVVSASSDKVLHVWSLTNGETIQTYLLKSLPLCVTLDPVDRAAYVGYKTGGVQMLDLHAVSGVSRSETAMQASPGLLWELNDGEASADSVNAVAVSYDGSTVLSAHVSGKINSWDVGSGKWRSTVHVHERPVSNIIMARPQGLPQRHADGGVKLKEVTKPRFDNVGGRAGEFPITAQLAGGTKPLSSTVRTYQDAFTHALCSSVIPDPLIHEGLAAFSHSAAVVARHRRPTVPATDGTNDLSEDLGQQNETLMSQLKEALAGQQKAIKQCMAYERDQYFGRIEAERKKARKKTRRLREMKVKEIQRKDFMGEAVSEADRQAVLQRAPDEEEGGLLSSDTSEVTD